MAFQIFTVTQLVEAVRPSDKPEGLSPRVAPDDSWAVVLRDLPPVTDPLLGGLLQSRPVSTPVVYKTKYLPFLRVKDGMWSTCRLTVELSGAHADV